MSNPFKAIDGLMLDCVFQRFVNATQRQPRWLADQFVMLFICAVVLAFVFSKMAAINYFALFMGIGLAGLFLGRDAHTQNIFGMMAFRLIFLIPTIVGLGVYVGFSLNGELTAHSVALSLREVSSTCVVYLLSCKPPAPRKRRESRKARLFGLFSRA